jgi:hypothetical protein
MKKKKRLILGLGIGFILIVCIQIFSSGHKHVVVVTDNVNLTSATGNFVLNGQRSIEEVKQVWENVKNKWDGIEIPIMLNLDPRTDNKHWWLNIPHEYRDGLHGIRAELGLEKPFWGLHMSLGYANEKWLQHSIYIHKCIKSGLIK